METFSGDVHLMCNNCVLYNGAASAYGKLALGYLRKWEGIKGKYIAKLSARTNKPSIQISENPRLIRNKQSSKEKNSDEEEDSDQNYKNPKISKTPDSKPSILKVTPIPSPPPLPPIAILLLEFDEDMDDKTALKCVLEAAWQFLSDADPENVFATAVTDLMAPGYSDEIKDPQDLSLIQLKIGRKKYKSIDSLDKDVQTMFNNCIKFDRDGSWYSIFAREARDLWDQKKALLQEAYISRTSIGGDDMNEIAGIEGRSEDEIMSRGNEGHEESDDKDKMSSMEADDKAVSVDEVEEDRNERKDDKGENTEDTFDAEVEMTFEKADGGDKRKDEKGDDILEDKLAVDDKEVGIINDIEMTKEETLVREVEADDSHKTIGGAPGEELRQDIQASSRIEETMPIEASASSSSSIEMSVEDVPPQLISEDLSFGTLPSLEQSILDKDHPPPSSSSSSSSSSTSLVPSSSSKTESDDLFKADLIAQESSIASNNALVTATLASTTTQSNVPPIDLPQEGTVPLMKSPKPSVTPRGITALKPVLPLPPPVLPTPNGILLSSRLANNHLKNQVITDNTLGYKSICNELPQILAEGKLLWVISILRDPQIQILLLKYLSQKLSEMLKMKSQLNVKGGHAEKNDLLPTDDLICRFVIQLCQLSLSFEYELQGLDEVLIRSEIPMIMLDILSYDGSDSAISHEGNEEYGIKNSVSRLPIDIAKNAIETSSESRVGCVDSTDNVLRLNLLESISKQLLEHS